MSKGNMKIENGVVIAGLDMDQDGDNSISVKLHLNEAFQEALARGGAVPGAKVVDFKLELTKLKVKLDTDKDGEALLELEIDLAEIVGEISSLRKK